MLVEVRSGCQHGWGVMRAPFLVYRGPCSFCILTGQREPWLLFPHSLSSSFSLLPIGCSSLSQLLFFLLPPPSGLLPLSQRPCSVFFSLQPSLLSPLCSLSFKTHTVIVIFLRHIPTMFLSPLTPVVLCFYSLNSLSILFFNLNHLLFFNYT